MLIRSLLLLLALTSTPLFASPAQQVLREQRSVAFAGIKEDWRLIWRGKPRSASSCGLGDPALAMTCPCDGFAYSEVGDLVLERHRPGAPPERMPLSPLFAGTDMLFNEKSAVAMLPRWPARLRDIEHNPTPAAIRARPAVRIIRLRNYNHDGFGRQFLLQVDAGPCGHHTLVAVGTTRDDPHLHALTTAEHPERPLALEPWEWKALARSASPGELIAVPCGDHGAEQNTTVVLKTDRGRIHATRITSTCPDITDANGNWHHDDHFLRKVLSKEVL